MVTVSQLSTALRCGDDGLWRAPSTAPISYPGSGNTDCFELEDRSFWFRHRNNCIATVIRRHPPQGVILDLGGGNGYVTRRLLDEGYDALLLEPGIDGALNAHRARNIPQVICATFDDAALLPATVAAVGLFDVIEHVPNDQQFLRKIHEVLVPGGLLYLTVPMHPWLWSAADVWAGHCRRYRNGALKTLLSRDYDLCFESYFFAPLVLPIGLLRALPYRLGIGREETPLRAAVEHGVEPGLARKALDWLLHREVTALATGRSQRFGASLIAVARKRS